MGQFVRLLLHLQNRSPRSAVSLRFRSSALGLHPSVWSIAYIFNLSIISQHFGQCPTEGSARSLSQGGRGEGQAVCTEGNRPKLGWQTQVEGEGQVGTHSSLTSGPRPGCQETWGVCNKVHDPEVNQTWVQFQFCCFTDRWA